MKPKPKPIVPSPAATGDAGGHFEQHVGAFYVALLLVGAVPPVLINTSIVEVGFQTRHRGWRTDDLLVVGITNAGVRRKLAAQVKRNLTISASDEDCRKVFTGLWDDFQAKDQFNASEDRLAIIALHGTSTLLNTFNSLLSCASGSIDAADFHSRINSEGFISKKAKNQNNVIKSILSEHIGKPPSDDDYWQFLRVVNVISYDFNTPTAQTEAVILSLLAQFVTKDATDPITTARATWAKLLKIVGQGRPIAAIYQRENLPSEIVECHTTIHSAGVQGLPTLIEHGKIVRDSIDSKIGNSYEIDKSAELIALSTKLNEHQVVIVSGIAGSGKSALVKIFLNQIEENHLVLAFRATEFATAHIDESLRNAQTTMNTQRLLAMLAGHNRIVILVEGVERLLEHSVRDAFSHLLQVVQQNRTIQLLITCRDYSVETVKNSLIAPLDLSYSIREVHELSDEELRLVQASVPVLNAPLQDNQIRSLLRTPFFLDMASRLNWREGEWLENTRAFREKCWKEVIRKDQFNAVSMPQRREKAFVDVAYRRAIELRPFVQCSLSDIEALDALVQDSLIEKSSQSSSLFAPAHDVLEDWAIVHLLDKLYFSVDYPEIELSTRVNGYPALRRGFRRWLGEQFELDRYETGKFVLRVLKQPELPSHFQDDCLVAALLSETASDFLVGCMNRIRAGDTQLLTQIIHMLRVACKASPHWLNVSGLPSQIMVPKGPGWVPVLQAVSRSVESLLPAHALLILGLVEDWAKQITLNNSSPQGFDDAGLIIDSLLPCFDDYKFDDARKRTLEVLLKIPRAVGSFQELIERAEKSKFQDRVADDFFELILGGIYTYPCYDYPAEVIELIDTRLRLTDLEYEHEHHFSRPEVSEVFGINEEVDSKFTPASAFRGPFLALLKSQPLEALDFILALLNHAADWYGTQRQPQSLLEPAWQITLQIPNSGSVQQWMNGRFFGMYRGMTVGPAALKSALMALEAWLLEIAKMDDVNLEKWLLYVLRTSNNVMATAVVASVCIAHPNKAGRAGLALISSRELVQCDLSRVASEDPQTLEAFSGIIPLHHIYEEERKKSNRLGHRKKHLETLAFRMQFTEYREDVWRIIDRHRSQLSSEQDDKTRLWRLALHRIDVREYQTTDGAGSVDKEPESIENVRDRVYVSSGEIEPDLQSIVDANAESMVITSRHLTLLNRARNALNDRSSQESANWRELLSEARSIEQELEEPEDLFRGGPGIVAAICIRDHVEELDDDEFGWCAQRVEIEVRRNTNDPDGYIRYTGGGIHWPDRVCASIVPILVLRKRSAAKALLALALTHPVDEVAMYAHLGVGAFLKDPHKELAIHCAAAAAYRSRLTAAVQNEEAKLFIDEQTYVKALTDRILPKVRQFIENDVIDAQSELALLDFNDRTSSTAIRMILAILEHHPEWEESHQFYSQVTECIAKVWATGRRYSNDFETLDKVLGSVARFSLKLPSEDSGRLCRPLIDVVDDCAREVADFLQELILAADAGTDDCFWDLWQNLADKVVNSSWITQLDNENPYEQPLVDRIFLQSCWKDDVNHWRRLEGHAHRIDALAKLIPATAACLKAYSEFLYTIGQQSLPDSFEVVADFFIRGEATSLAANSEITFCLESLLRRFVYSEPQRLKANQVLRGAVLVILDALVSAGSSSAYQMRDDFVTPLSGGSR